eukprot:6173618-Amphidinium_carterae.2
MSKLRISTKGATKAPDQLGATSMPLEWPLLCHRTSSRRMRLLQMHMWHWQLHSGQEVMNSGLRPCAYHGAFFAVCYSHLNSSTHRTLKWFSDCHAQQCNDTS